MESSPATASAPEVGLSQQASKTERATTAKKAQPKTAAQPKKSPAPAKAFPRNDDLQNLAEQEVGGEVVNENPGLGTVIWKGAVAGGKLPLSGNKSKGKSKTVAMLKAPVVGAQTPRKERQARAAQNEARRTAVEKAHRRLGHEALEARKFPQEQEGHQE